jgi:hypothetical protein
MRALARWECPEHGVATTFGSNPSRGGRYSLCPEHGTIVEAVWVEYVHPDTHQGAVKALEKIRDWDLDPMDDAEYVWDELRKIAVEVVGSRPATNRGSSE